MTTNNEKIDSKFRKLTDLFFCTDRKDLDLTEFRELLNNCNSNYVNYFITRFDRATAISWDDNADYWYNRLCFILSLENKKIKREVYSRIEDRFVYFIERAANIKDNLSIIQYIQICCARKHLGLPLEREKRFLLYTSNFLTVKRSIDLCKLFIPVIWKSNRHLMDNILFELPKLNNAISVLEYLKNSGYYLDSKKIARMVMDSCVRIETNPIKSSLFFNLLNDKDVLLEFKKMYTPSIRKSLYKKVECLGVTALTYDNCGINILNLVIDIDPELSEQLTGLYITYLYTRYIKHTRSNIDRIVKLINEVKGVNPKIVLVYLTKLNKHKDIKRMVKAYPELKKLSLFV